MFTLRQGDNGWELVDATGAVVGRPTAEVVEAITADATRGLVAAVDPPASMHWQGVITVENQLTGDGRGSEPGAWAWDTPFPLTWQREGGGHEGATVVGTVWEVYRDGDLIRGRGTFDLGSDEGREAARQVGEGLTTDLSIEPDSVDVELRVAAEVAEAWDQPMDDEFDEDAPERETDDEGRVILDRIHHDDMVEVVTAGRIRTLALVTTAAYDEATIELADGVELEALLAGEVDADPDDAEPEPATEEAVVAAAIPSRPPATWFDDPQLDGPTAVQVTDEGRVYGHLATWGTCHIGRDDVCLTPPNSEAAYAYFATGEVAATCEPCDDGATVVSIPTGTITMGTGHADLAARPRQAMEHYDNTGAAVADVTAGEDEHGIWVAGALRPDATEAQVRALRGSSLSGDWRRIGGALELVAALAVNVPGFPIPRSVAASAGLVDATPRPRAHHTERRTLALVAAGTVPPTMGRDVEFDDDTPVVASALPPEVTRALGRMERVLAPQVAAQLRREVHGGQRSADQLRAGVHGER